MLRHPEDVELALLIVPVAAYALENGGAVVQGVSHNAYLSVFDWDYLSTEEGKRLRHLATLLCSWVAAHYSQWLPLGQ